jgi:hypothetical protein
MRARTSLAALGVALGALAGCATGAPALSGSRTTPDHRVDTWLGGSARIALGQLAQERVTGPAGLVPTAVLRAGLSDRFDLSARVDGTTASVEARLAFELQRSDAVRTTLLLGLRPFGGLALHDGVEVGGRAGVELPVIVGVDAGGVYELWAGARASQSWSWGTASGGGSFDGRTTELGGLVGLALGFRALAFAAELAFGYETRATALAGATGTQSGVVLSPAFAVRLRW